MRLSDLGKHSGDFRSHEEIELQRQVQKSQLEINRSVKELQKFQTDINQKLDAGIKMNQESAYKQHKFNRRQMWVISATLIVSIITLILSFVK